MEDEKDIKGDLYKLKEEHYKLKDEVTSLKYSHERLEDAVKDVKSGYLSITNSINTMSASFNEMNTNLKLKTKDEEHFREKLINFMEDQKNKWKDLEDKRAKEEAEKKEKLKDKEKEKSALKNTILSNFLRVFVFGSGGLAVLKLIYDFFNK